MCDSAGNRNSRNLSTSFLAVPTPTSSGSSHITLILMILMISMTARNASSSFPWKNFFIFLKRILGVASARAWTAVRGTNSSLASMPFPSMDRGSMRKMAPSNITSGMRMFTSWVSMNLTVLSCSAVVTSSIGEVGSKSPLASGISLSTSSSCCCSSSLASRVYLVKSTRFLVNTSRLLTLKSPTSSDSPRKLYTFFWMHAKVGFLMHSAINESQSLFPVEKRGRLFARDVAGSGSRDGVMVRLPISSPSLIMVWLR
uniref:(northern house mosquito) hypothetical protein n=1 Tax=Culex pipiens TaxID=7175 RepID=A0A8D8G9K4_CULPI